MIVHPQLEGPDPYLARAAGWLGGLWTLVFAVAVLAPFAIGGLSLVGSPLLQHDEDAALSSRLGRPMRVIFPYYLALTVLGVIGMAAGGGGFVASLCMALSGISGTGTSVISGVFTRLFHCSRNCRWPLCVCSAPSVYPL